MKPSEVLDEVERLNKQPRRVRLFLVIGALAAGVLVMTVATANTYFAEKAKQWAAPAATVKAESAALPPAPAASAQPGSPPAAHQPGSQDADVNRIHAIDVFGSPVRGPADAPLTIVEFMDFEGPFCKDVDQMLARLETALPGKIRRVYKSYPIASHQHSRQAARAVLAAEAQNKFWPMHDALFQNQDRLDPGAIETLAAQVGIGHTEFLSELARVDDRRIEGDLKQAKALGVTRIPAVFINGHPMLGKHEFAAYEKLAHDLLSRL